MRTEPLDDGNHWLRLADPAWADPLDATCAAQRGGRWTPPGGPATLYLNETVATARANLRRFLAGTPVEPEDLDGDGGYALVEVTLPDGQQVLDAHSTAGLAAVDLPPTYPLDRSGGLVRHATCQPIGQAAFDAGLDGVHCRSAASETDAGLRDLAWFPRTRTATALETRPFGDWYFSRS